MMFYLAGPIAGTAMALQSDWRDRVGAQLTERGHVAFRPDRAFAAPADEVGPHYQDAGRYVEQLNRQAVRFSAGLIADLSRTRGIGTIREIEFARSLSRPVLAFLPFGPVSLSMWDCDIHQVHREFWEANEEIAVLSGVLGAWLSRMGG